MSKERPLPLHGFEFTEREKLFYQVSHARFRVFFDDERTTIHSIELSENSFGEFLFITTSRPGKNARPVTFYGLGYHQERERWIHKEFFWFQANAFSSTTAQVVPKEEADEILRQREEAISAYVDRDTQTARGRFFETMADLVDEDGALAEMDDLGEVWDRLAEPPEEPEPSQSEPIVATSMTRADLISCRPDLRERIVALDESDIRQIADKLGDALQEAYWSSLKTILSDYLNAGD